MTTASSDLEFLHFNHLPNCKAWINHVFRGYCALNYAHAGRIRWKMNDGSERELIAPVAWWTWPGPLFTYGWPEDPGWDHSYVTFSGSWARQLQKSGLLPATEGAAYQAVRDAEKFQATMLALLAALEQRDSWKARALLLELLLELRDTRSGQAHGVGRNRLAEVVRLIREKPQLRWSEEAMARRCALSRVQFRRRFQEEAGEPFHRFCVKAKMDFAARLLRMTETPIKEITTACGLPDIYQFSRLFRQHQGIPPGQYRRETRLMPGRF